MTKGLLKSFLLHFGVLFLFLYGAEIFKKNKRFEIYEIPLDIIDISEKTVNKIDNIKKKNKQKKINKKEYFSPPVVKSKPKPPEFAVKEKKKDKVDRKEEKEKEKNIPKKKDKKRMESILKSIEKVKTANKSTDESKKDEEDIINEKEEVKNVKLGEKLTISEKDAIRRQFYRCWIVPAGAKNLKDLIVTVKIKVNEEGEVYSSTLVNKSQLKDPFYRAASESAMRAVNHPECKKLKVPKKKYETWKDIILEFDPSQSLN